MKQHWQMISDNGGWLKPATVTLSTVKMPEIKGIDLGYRYESCLFTKGDSEVLARYDTVADAVLGHRDLSTDYGLTER